MSKGQGREKVEVTMFKAETVWAKENTEYYPLIYEDSWHAQW